MKKQVLLCYCLLVYGFSITQVNVKNLLCENLSNPVGIDIKKPRLTWQLVSDKRKTVQTAYEIRVESNASLGRIGNSLVWQTGKINSDQSVQVPYTGAELKSSKKYYWQVRVWDNNGKVSSWSEPAFWTMGLLNPSDWKAKWISPGFTEDSVMRPSPLFRKNFSANKNLRSATAYITSHGLYEAKINGKRIGEAYLTPGWTAYNKRLQYQVYDVTGMIQSGNNAISAILGNGWYRGIIGFSNNKNVYGKDVSLLFQLDIEFNDGTKQSIVSDESWKSSTGSIRSSEIYNGETIDAREEKTGWTMAGYDDSKWNGIKVLQFPVDNLIATYNEPVKKHETFKPVKIFKTPMGEQVIDFGQNLVGWVMVKVKGNAGDSIKIQHAEVLDKNGNFYTENLREAKAEDIFILKGKEEELFEPHFTFHGFRYIKIDGYPEAINPENFTAVALYSDMKTTGTFSSSNTLINQLQHNIQWGQKGNFLDVPTDCPQRDERLGWTGDAQVFSRTASFNMQVNNFFAKWLKDVAADQQPNGSVPFVIPNILGAGAGGATGWADVATIIPWNMYLAYGDKRILEEQYNSMKSWVTYMEKNSKNNLWNTGFHFGDWLSYMQDNDLMGRSAITDKYLIAQCFFAHSTQILIKVANILNKQDDVAKYTELLQKIKEAFVTEYVTPNGRLTSNTQTAYVLALNFDMLPESLRAQAVDRLVRNIKDYNNHLSTGFLGTPYLCHVLSRFGKTDIAYQLLMQETFPSWLYPVKMGATTIWERWNGIRPDSSFEPASMNSFNHYAYGAIGDWMYRQVAGIDTYEDAPGYRHILIKPHIGGNLSFANAELKTYYGLVSSQWKIDNGKLELDVKIPENTKATIYIPALMSEVVHESGKPLSDKKEIISKGKEQEYVVVEVGSGNYHFTTELPKNKISSIHIPINKQ